MSMSTSISYGYGVDMANTYIETTSLLRFFENHLPDEYAKMLEHEECPDFENSDDSTCRDFLIYYFEENDFADCSACNSCYGIIPYVMRKETDVGFEEVRGDDEWAIIFPECLPWLLNDTEKSLTKEKLDEILTKYFSELGISVTPDLEKVESFG